MRMALTGSYLGYLLVLFVFVGLVAAWLFSDTLFNTVVSAATIGDISVSLVLFSVTVAFIIIGGAIHYLQWGYL